MLTAAQYAAMSKAYHQERRLTDLQFAWMRQLLAEPHRNQKSHPQPFKTQDFALFVDQDDENSVGSGQTPDEQLAMVKSWIHPYFEARSELDKQRGKE